MTDSTTEQETLETPASPEQEPAPAVEGPEAQAQILYCPQCGARMAVEDRYCGACGWDSEEPARSAPMGSPRKMPPPSDKSRLTALLLCVLIGWLGAHRFYVGKTGTGVLWLLTGGILVVGWIYDMVMIATGEFTDEQGRRIAHWE